MEVHRLACFSRRKPTRGHQRGARDLGQRKEIIKEPTIWKLEQQLVHVKADFVTIANIWKKFDHADKVQGRDHNNNIWSLSTCQLALWTHESCGFHIPNPFAACRRRWRTRHMRQNAWQRQAIHDVRRRGEQLHSWCAHRTMRRNWKRRWCC